MSDTDYLVWLIATAVITAAVLAIGTMIAAEIIPLGRRRGEEDVEEQAEPAAEDDGPVVEPSVGRRRAA